MTKPTGYNVPSGVDAEDFLSDALLSMLADVFVAVTDAFGDDASLYRIDIGNLIKSTEAGGMVFAGQFVDRSDGEIFNFEINQATNKLQYKSSGEFLNEQDLAAFTGELHMEEADQASENEFRAKGEQLYELLYDATHNPASEAGQSPFGIKLSKDLDYLAALSAAMYQAVITIEAQPLYAGLHSYVIQYALRGLRLFAQAIGNAEGPDAGALAEKWLDANGINFATGFVRAFSSQRCDLIKEQIQAEDHSAIEQLEADLEEALAMAMACTIDLIKNISAADDYEEGDVGSALAAAIEEYCPIDNSEGYHVSEHPRQLGAEWQQVIEHSGCSEDLSMNALGLPVADRIPTESDPTTMEKMNDLDLSEGINAESGEGERIFYVNVGEGPSRSWDDCRQFGFLAAGGGRKWSKQLEKIQIGDTVIAYLKGYGYVGIGRVTCTATPATKFMVNGVLIKELPLVNDTIRSIKRFSKENGEYLIGVDWQVAVSREQAAWESNAGLYTTALVCATLRNQPETVSFVSRRFLLASGIAPAQSVSLLKSEGRRDHCTPAVEYMNRSSYYNPNDYGWDVSDVFNFPPGKYFLGDPAHALADDLYSEACEIAYNDSGFVNGVGNVAIFKCPGDGVYTDEDGFAYPVSSGTLGVVPIGHLSDEQAARLEELGRVLSVEGDATNPNWDEEGEGFSAMIDSQGHIFLGAAWIFCGDEHPLRAEFWKYLEENDLDGGDFWPSEVTKVIHRGTPYYFGLCENDGDSKCFIIETLNDEPALRLAPARDVDCSGAEIPGYLDKSFESLWIELSAISGVSSTV